MEAVELVVGQELLQMPADCLCRLGAVLRGPGCVAVRDHVVRKAEAVHPFR